MTAKRFLQGFLTVFLMAVSAAGQTHDSVVVIPPPITVRIPAGAGSTRRSVSTLVRNGDHTPGTSHAVELTLSHDCPGGTIVAGPDFQPNSDSINATIVLAAGKVKRAVTELRIDSAAFTSVNHSTPQRCTLTFHADTPLPGNVDPTPRNNSVTLELNVIDLNDPPQSNVREVLVESIRVFHPKKIRVGPSEPVRSGRYRPLVTNASSSDADEITLLAEDGDCPPGSVGLLDFDELTPDEQNSTEVAPATRTRGVLEVTVDGASFFSTGHTVPDRCTAILTAVGANGDTDTTNNITRLPINVVDDSDY